MNLPRTRSVSLPVEIQRCSTNVADQRRTDVVATFAGCELRAFSVPGNVDEVGFEALWPTILSTILAQIDDALELAE